MSVRLNVIVVQSPQMSNLQVGVVAEIVIQLLGRPGIDVAMVTSLEPKDEQSTDRLMLTGIENDLAVVDWRGFDETLSSLSALGMDVARARHALDLEAPSAAPGSRRVYVFDLRHGFKAVEVVQTLATLLEQRQVVTVSLSLAKPVDHRGTASHAATKPPLTATPAAAVASAATASPTSNLAEPVSRTDGASAPQRQSLEDEARLEALVDHLNDIDL